MKNVRSIQILSLVVLLMLAGCATPTQPHVNNMLLVPLEDLGDDDGGHLVCISSHLNIQWGVLTEYGDLALYQNGPRTLNGQVTHILPSPSGKGVAIASWGGEGATPGLHFFSSERLLDWLWGPKTAKERGEEVEPMTELTAYPAQLIPVKWINDQQFAFSCNMDFANPVQGRLAFEGPDTPPMRMWKIDVQSKRITALTP